MTDKKTIAEIEKKLAQGLRKKQIFADLGRGDDLATAIASAPYPEDRRRYRRLNDIFVAILSYASIVKVLVLLLSVYTQNLPVYAALLGAFWPFVYAYLAFQAVHFKGWCYLPAAFLCLALFLNGLEPIFSQTRGTALIINLLIIAPLFPGLLIGLQLRKRLCPDLGFMGARTDESGTYNFI